MGLTLMADDVSRLLGRLEAGFDAIIDRVNRSDDATAQKFRELAEQHERDKNLAISAREAKHAENLSRFQAIDEKVTTTYGLATVAYQWVTEKAPPLIERVDKIDTRIRAIEDGKKVEAAEDRGEKKAWGTILAYASAIGTVIAGVATLIIQNGRDLLDLMMGRH